ncbi:MAG: hypothetical protein LIP09_10025 [Bacteroidales bacterium]|nr:hypothetical protein [Bacteroidales bacterium]
MPTSVSFKKVFSQLFLTWAICRGAIITLIVLGWCVPCMWLPFIGFALMIPVLSFANYSLSRGQFNCSLETHYTIYSLFISALIMLIINIMNTKWCHWGIAANMHDPHPFISTLIVYPVTAILFGFALMRRKHTSYCKACKEQNTFSVRMTIECNVFTAQAMDQLKMHVIMSTLVSIATWAYYIFFYINVNINSPDTFFFFIVPLTVFLLSLVYFSSKYSNMNFEASISPMRLDHDNMTKMRYMVVGGDKVMLQEVAKDKCGLGLWDTPAVCEVPFSDNIEIDQAKATFKNMSGADDFEIRYLFSINTSKTITYHYAAFVPVDENMPGLEGKWFNLYQIDMMMKSGMISRAFAFEMHRIFTITMAWKTYDREGKRLYPIKNYRPTFRLKDFKDWNVDYTDLHWISVSQNNEDRPFFRLRRFWRRYISGNDLRWKHHHRSL